MGTSFMEKINNVRPMARQPGCRTAAPSEKEIRGRRATNISSVSRSPRSLKSQNLSTTAAPSGGRYAILALVKLIYNIGEPISDHLRSIRIHPFVDGFNDSLHFRLPRKAGNLLADLDYRLSKLQRPIQDHQSYQQSILRFSKRF